MLRFYSAFVASVLLHSPKYLARTNFLPRVFVIQIAFTSLFIRGITHPLVIQSIVERNIRAAVNMDIMNLFKFCYSISLCSMKKDAL